MIPVPENAPTLEQWQEHLAVSDAMEIEKTRQWALAEMQALISATPPGGTVPPVYSYYSAVCAEAECARSDGKNE